jgi:hypothetical protein
MKSPALALTALLLTPPATAATIQDLLRAYPDALESTNGSEIIWRDGTKMPIDDNQPNKTPEQLLRNGSIQDQLSQTYPAGAPILPPQQDPGRIRNHAFFTKMYGDCQAGEVAPKLTPIIWLPKTWGHTIRITSVNGIDKQLTAISSELDNLPPEDKKYLYPLGGTYNCRPVADTGVSSMHAWGAAIDINVAYSDYWLWRRTAPYTNRIPPEIVSIFEQHGFIWGGRWAHYDTMHFEYRPELLPSH